MITPFNKTWKKMIDIMLGPDRSLVYIPIVDRAIEDLVRKEVISEGSKRKRFFLEVLYRRDLVSHRSNRRF